MLQRFSLIMEAQHRMPARILQVLDHVQLDAEEFSLARCGGQIAVSFVVDAQAQQMHRIESLLWKVVGMLSVETSEEPTAATDESIASFQGETGQDKTSSVRPKALNTHETGHSGQVGPSSAIPQEGPSSIC